MTNLLTCNTHHASMYGVGRKQSKALRQWPGALRRPGGGWTLKAKLPEQLVHALYNDISLNVWLSMFPPSRI